MPQSDPSAIRHSFAVGDKIWYGEKWGQVIDLTHRRVKIAYLNEQENLVELWLNPESISRRS
jgi:hypothetical protein